MELNNTSRADVKRVGTVVDFLKDLALIAARIGHFHPGQNCLERPTPKLRLSDARPKHQNAA